MAYFDVFNGDADGICALTQLRLAEPRESILVTGVKRDIALLDRVHAGHDDHVTVLDVSLDKNRTCLERLLEADARIHYCDHHFAGEIPQHVNLKAHINTAPDVCTSLLVNGDLGNRFVHWALVGAYGDNLDRSAEILAHDHGIKAEQLAPLKQLGIYLNYNGYGEAVEDLHFAPDELFRLVSAHATPMAFIREQHSHFERLQNGYNDDMAKARAIKPETESRDSGALFIFPNTAWARRVSGVYSNDLAAQHPDRAHAVLTEKSDGSYVVSVRAPLNRKDHADTLCREFPTGGGRKAAAGINSLPRPEIQRFANRFFATYG